MRCCTCGRELVANRHPLVALIEHVAPPGGSHNHLCTDRLHRDAESKRWKAKVR